MSDKISERLAEARRALRAGDREVGSEMLDQILREDFFHSGAWELLHQEFGPRHPFEQFQRKFVERYYPDKIGLLEAGPDLPDFFAETDLDSRPLSKPRDDVIGQGRRVRQGPESPAARPAEPKQKKEKKGLFSRLFGFLRRDRSKEQAAPAKKKQGLDMSRFDRVTRSQVDSPPIANPYAGLSDDDFDLDELGDGYDSTGMAAPDPLYDVPTDVPKHARPTLKEGEKIRIIIVDDVMQTRDNLRRLLLLEQDVEVVAMASSGRDAVEMVAEELPDVVLMDINMPDMDGIEATRRLRERAPFAQVVMLTVQDDPSYMREAIRAGARDFLIKPPTVDDLLSAIYRAYEISQDEQKRAAGPAYPDPVMMPVMTPEKSGSRIITVFSPKGGSGCTLLATNLAVALQRDDSQVVAVDGSLHFGGVAIAFNLRGKTSLLDLAPRVHELDPDVVNDVLFTHDVSQVRVLAAPENPVDSDIVNGQQVKAMMEYLGQLYPYLIVDAGHEINDISLALFDISDQIILVTTQDIPALFRVRKFLDLALAIGLPAEKITFVMNRYNSKINITPEKVADNFNLKMQAIIPSDYQAAMTSMNRGVPLLLDSKLRRRPIAAAVKKMASQVKKRVAQAEAV